MKLLVSSSLSRPFSWLKALYLVFLLGSSHFVLAQNSYIGFAATAAISPSNSATALFGVQFGTALSDELELRFAAESLIIVNNVMVDLLYAFKPNETGLHFYSGGGANLFFDAFSLDYGNPTLGLHATTGLEQRLGITGLYAELQLGVLVTGAVLTKVRGGINIYF